MKRCQPKRSCRPFSIVAQSSSSAGGPDFEEFPLQKSNHEVAERTSYPRFPSPPLKRAYNLNFNLHPSTHPTAAPPCPSC